MLLWCYRNIRIKWLWGHLDKNVAFCSVRCMVETCTHTISRSTSLTQLEVWCDLFWRGGRGKGAVGHPSTWVCCHCLPPPAHYDCIDPFPAQLSKDWIICTYCALTHSFCKLKSAVFLFYLHGSCSWRCAFMHIVAWNKTRNPILLG